MMTLLFFDSDYSDNSDNSDNSVLDKGVNHPSIDKK